MLLNGHGKVRQSFAYKASNILSAQRRGAKQHMDKIFVFPVLQAVLNNFSGTTGPDEDSPLPYWRLYF